MVVATVRILRTNVYQLEEREGEKGGEREGGRGEVRGREGRRLIVEDKICGRERGKNSIITSCIHGNHL